MTQPIDRRPPAGTSPRKNTERAIHKTADDAKRPTSSNFAHAPNAVPLTSDITPKTMLLRTAPLSLSNPILELLQLESTAIPNDLTADAEMKLRAIIARMREAHSSPPTTPQKAILEIIDQLQSKRIDGSFHTHFFSEDLANDACSDQTATLALIAVGHELNWPVEIIAERSNLLLRWKGEGRPGFVISGREIYADAPKTLIDEFDLAPESVEGGVYLAPLTGDRLRSTLMFHAAKAMLNRGDLDKGAALLQKAVALDSKNVAAHFELGRVFAGRGKHAEAIATFGDVIALDPRNRLALAFRANKRSRIEDHVGAKEDFLRAVALSPDDIWLRFALSLAHAALEEFADAETQINLIIDSGTNDLIFFKARGAIRLERGHYAAALDDFDRTLITGDNGDDIRSIRAEALLGLKRYPEAETDFKEHLVRHPDDVDALVNLAEAYRGMKKTDLARETLRRALTLDPQNERALAIQQTLSK